MAEIIIGTRTFNPVANSSDADPRRERASGAQTGHRPPRRSSPHGSRWSGPWWRRPCAPRTANVPGAARVAGKQHTRWQDWEIKRQCIHSWLHRGNVPFTSMRYVSPNLGCVFSSKSTDLVDSWAGMTGLPAVVQNKLPVSYVTCILFYDPRACLNSPEGSRIPPLKSCPKF